MPTMPLPSMNGSTRSKSWPRTARGQRTRDEILVAAQAVFEREPALSSPESATSPRTPVSGMAPSISTSNRRKTSSASSSTPSSRSSWRAPRTSSNHKVTTRPSCTRSRRSPMSDPPLLPLLQAQRLAVGDPRSRAATFNDDFRRIRTGVRHVLAHRTEERIRVLQAAGIADPTIDARVAALLLRSMVDSFAYHWRVLGEKVAGSRRGCDDDETVRAQAMD